MQKKINIRYFVLLMQLDGGFFFCLENNWCILKQSYMLSKGV